MKDAKSRIVPVRFRARDLEKIADVARARNQTVSGLVRTTLLGALGIGI
jgi:hypothetical protein